MPWHGNNATIKLGQAAVDRVSCNLRITAIENESAIVLNKAAFETDCWNGFVNPESAFKPFISHEQPCSVYVRTYPQFLVNLVACPEVKKGEIWLSEVQRKNLEVCTGSIETFSVHTVAEPILSEVVLDIRPREMISKSYSKVVVNANAVTRHLHTLLKGKIVTRDEIFLLPVDAIQSVEAAACLSGAGPVLTPTIACVLYATDVDVPFDKEADARAFTVLSVLRGRVGECTQIYLQKDPKARTANAQFVLTDTRKRPERPKPRLMIELKSDDGELVPVKKALMRPCIKLASKVMEGHGVHALDMSGSDGVMPSAEVAMDCCTLDRVLLYLEAEAAIIAVSSVHASQGAATGSTKATEGSSAESFVVDLDEATELLDAARSLGCAGLEAACLQRLGQAAARVRLEGIPWVEVVRRNQEGEVLICIDGMIFDVTRWLPEHPGGSTIIPKQALNMDAARMFEIYHVGREPFMFLQQFYIGDVLPVDYASKSVPLTKTKPSKEFLVYLREFSPWRKRPVEKVHKSF